MQLADTEKRHLLEKKSIFNLKNEKINISNIDVQCFVTSIFSRFYNFQFFMTSIKIKKNC